MSIVAVLILLLGLTCMLALVLAVGSVDAAKRSDQEQTRRNAVALERAKKVLDDINADR